MNGIYFVVLFCAGAVLSETATNFEPCSQKDTACITNSASQLYQRLATHDPELNNTAIDPLHIHSFNVEYYKNIMFYLRNIEVTGLKDTKITGYHLNLAKERSNMNMETDMELKADITIEHTDVNKKFTGTYTLKTKANTLLAYPVRVNNGKFDAYTETTFCTITGEPEITFSTELQEALNNDDDAKAKSDEYVTKVTDLNKRVACRIMTKIVTMLKEIMCEVVQDTPATAFFNDL